MSTVDYDTYDERRHLFTKSDDNDMRGNLFTRALEKCQSKSPDTCTLINDIARASSYEDYCRKGMSDIDIHYQFVDFIVKSALYHREIDKPFGAGNRVEQAKTTIKYYTDAITGADNRMMDETKTAKLTYNLEFLRTTGDDYTSNVVDDWDWAKFLLGKKNAAADDAPQFVIHTKPNHDNPQILQAYTTKLDYMNDTQIGAPDLLLLIAMFGSRFTSFDEQTNVTFKDTVVNRITENQFVEYLKAIDHNVIYNASSTDMLIPSEILDYFLGEGELPSGVNFKKGLITHILYSAGIVTRNVGAPPNYSELSNGADARGTVIKDADSFTQRGDVKNMHLVRHSLKHILDEMADQLKKDKERFREDFITLLKPKLKEFVFKWAAKVSIMITKDKTGDTATEFAKPYSAVTVTGDQRESFRKSAYNVLKRELFPHTDAEVKDVPGLVKNIASDLKNIITSTFTDYITKYFIPAYTTMEKSEAAKDLYNNVFKNWNRMTTGTKEFYKKYMMIMKRTGTGWVSVDDWTNLGGISLSDYRFNLKKDQGDLSMTKFGNDLPYFPQKDLGRVYYTNWKGDNVPKDATLIATNDKYFFRTLYTTIYKETKGSELFSFNKNNIEFDLPGNYEHARRVQKDEYFNGLFCISIDKLVRKRLFRISKAKIDITEPEDETVQYKFADMIQGDQWFLKDGKFVKEIDGKVKEFGKNDPETHKLLKASHMCYSSLFPADPKSCNKYMFECVLSDEKDALNSCIAQFKTVDFEKTAAKEINNMHPLIALRTLQKLGFKSHEVKDSLLGDINKAETVEHWMNRLSRKLSPEEMKNLKADNGYVLSYLNLVVQFVNSNPGILNKGISGKTEESVGKARATKYIKELGIPQRIEPGGGTHELTRLRQNLQSSLRGISILNKRISPFMPLGMGLRTPFGTNLTPGVSTVRGFQIGGGSVSWLLDRAYNPAQGSYCGASLMKEIFEGLIDDLGKRNKMINTEDVNRIRKNLKEMEKTETALLKLLAYIEEFNSLKDALKDYKSETLTRENLIAFVDSYKNKQSMYLSNEHKLLKIIEGIAKILEKEGEDVNGYVDILQSFKSFNGDN